MFYFRRQIIVLDSHFLLINFTFKWKTHTKLTFYFCSNNCFQKCYCVNKKSQVQLHLLRVMKWLSLHVLLHEYFLFFFRGPWQHLCIFYCYYDKVIYHIRKRYLLDTNSPVDCCCHPWGVIFFLSVRESTYGCNVFYSKALTSQLSLWPKYL